MRIFIFTFVLFLFCCKLSLAQTSSIPYKFTICKNNFFKPAKNIDFLLVNQTDTIVCDVSKGQVKVPEISDVCKVVIKYKKKIYEIKEVDFSALKPNSQITFGIAKTNILKSLPNTPEDIYFIYSRNLSRAPVLINFKHIEEVNQFCFVNFTKKEPTSSKEQAVHSSATFTSILKRSKD